MRPMMTCAEADELLGAYALDALPEAERARVEEHLQTCTEHQAAAEELRRVTPLLALTVDEREASPALRQRILDAVRREPQVDRREPAGVRPVARGQRGFADTRMLRPPWWQWRPQVAAMVAAAVFLLALGIGVGRLITPPTPAQAVVTYTFAGNTAAPDARARLVYFKDQQQAVLDVTGLPALTPGQVYEMWLFQNNKPIDAGVASTSGELVARITRNLGQYQQLAITIEPGERPEPTTTPILVGALS